MSDTGTLSSGLLPAASWTATEAARRIVRELRAERAKIDAAIRGLVELYALEEPEAVSTSAQEGTLRSARPRVVSDRAHAEVDAKPAKQKPATAHPGANGSATRKAPGGGASQISRLVAALATLGGSADVQTIARKAGVDHKRAGITLATVAKLGQHVARLGRGKYALLATERRELTTMSKDHRLITDGGALRCSGPCGERHSLASQFPASCEQT